MALAQDIKKHEIFQPITVVFTKLLKACTRAGAAVMKKTLGGLAQKWQLGIANRIVINAANLGGQRSQALLGNPAALREPLHADE